MLGLFRKTAAAEPAGLDPEAPIEIKTSVMIDQSPDEVYALLDFADDRHQMRARGNPVQRIGSDPDEFRAWFDRAPNLNFLFKVDEAVPGHRYAYFARIVPPVGKRIQAREDYRLEAVDGGCKVTFVNTIQHVPGLTMAELDREVARSTTATLNGLSKLKLQAEKGVEAVFAFEREMGQRPPKPEPS
jgi:hypothetical protein